MRTTLFAAFAALLLAPPMASAQPGALKQELEFVEKMRQQGYADLALDYLENQLSKRFPKARNLELEIAITRMSLAEDELNVERRLALFRQVESDFEGFLRKRPSADQAAMARFQLARLSALQGRTQLRYARSLGPKDPARGKELLKARTLLEKAAKDLEARLKGLKDDALLNAQLDLGLLYIDQARTYSLAISDAEKRLKVLEKAQNALNKLTEDIPPTDPKHWVAMAWAGRAYQMNSEIKEADRRFDQILARAVDARRDDAKRLTYYFRILGEQERFEEEGKTVDHRKLESLAKAWIRLYGNRRTPELFGMWYVVAMQNLHSGLKQKNQLAKTAAFNEAKAAITRIESVDNEFITRAQTLKIQLLLAEGAFNKDPSLLISFDDLYMRALFEHQRFNEGGKDGKEFEKPEDKRKQQDKIIGILEKAMAKAEAKDKTALSRNVENSRFLLTGYHLATENLTKAVEVGNGFMRKSPKAAQAPDAALFAAQAQVQLIAKEKDDKKREQMQAQLLDMAQYMMKWFPREEAGKLGRYYVVQDLIDNGKLEEALAIPGTGSSAYFGIARKYHEKGEFEKAIELFNKIKPDFSNYIIAEYLKADSALQIARNNEILIQQGKAPIKLSNGKADPRVYAMDVLRKMPDLPEDPEYAAGLFYMQGKMRLAAMLYSEKKYDEMESISKKLLTTLPSVKLADDKAQSDEKKAKFRKTLNEYLVYAVYSKSRDQYNDAAYDKALAILEPVVKELQGATETGLKTSLKGNQALFNAVMGYALRSYIQLGRVPEGMKVLELWEKLAKEAGHAFNVKTILKQSIGAMHRQVKLLKQQPDKKKLLTTIESFSSFLDKVAPKEKEVDYSFLRVRVLAYSSIQKHQKASDLIQEKLPDDLSKVKAENQKSWKILQVYYVRELRLQGEMEKDEEKKKALFEKASKKIREILGSWGKKDLLAIKEEIHLLKSMTYYGNVVNKATKLAKELLPFLDRSPAVRSHYFDVYFHLISAYYLYGEKVGGDKGKKAIEDAARKYIKLKENYPDLGGETQKALYEDFLKEHEGFAKAVEQLKAE